MAEFSESLTIRILGDSSQFQQELESVTNKITDLQFQLSRVSDLAIQLGSSFSRLTGMLRPLIQVNRQLSQIETNIQKINRIPIVINVGPALKSLAALLSMLNAVIGRMQAVSAMSGRVGSSTGSGTATSGASSTGTSSGASSGNVGASSSIRMNSGGLVLGAGGVDRVPTMLSSGEFVFKRSAVQELGTNVLYSMNQDGIQSLPTETKKQQRGFSGNGTEAGVSERLFRFLRTRHQKNLLDERTGRSSDSSESAVNHHGDISIHVQQAVDVNSIIRDLRFADYRLRNRRG